MSGMLSNLGAFDASAGLKWGRPRKSEIAKIALAYTDALLKEIDKKNSNAQANWWRPDYS